MQISEQHKEILSILNNTKTHLFIIMGARSTGKSYDVANIINIKLLENVKEFLNSGQLKKICLMRQNQSDINNSVFGQFLKSYHLMREDYTPDYDKFLTVLDTTVKFNKDNRSENLIIKKGFRSSNKNNTAGTKSIVDINTYVIEEAEEITKYDFDKLYFTAIRENAQIILILNTPHKNHWIIQKYFHIIPYLENKNYYVPVLKTTKNVTYIKSTIEGNHFLSKETALQYTSFGDVNNVVDYDENRYHVDILGLVASNAVGRIIKDYSICTLEDFEQIEKKEKLGFDFGFTNDPTALVRIKTSNDTIYIDELIYAYGMSVKAMANEMNNKKVSKNSVIKYDTGDGGNRVADELHNNYGFKMIAAKKGQGSVIYGTERLAKMKIVVTERSSNVIQEFQNHVYETKNNGNHSNEPKDSYNHTIDAIRYANEEEEDKKINIRNTADQDFYKGIM